MPASYIVDSLFFPAEKESVMKRFFVFGASFLFFSCTYPELKSSDCLRIGEDCPNVPRDRVNTVTCQCICSTPLDAIYGPFEEYVRTCLPEGLNLSLAFSESRRRELLDMSDSDYYQAVNGWCSANVAYQLQNIAEGIGRVCGQTSCDCIADTSSLEEIPSCEEPCETVHCKNVNCPRSILDRDSGNVDIDRCRCTESHFCDHETSGTICRPDIDL